VREEAEGARALCTSPASQKKPIAGADLWGACRSPRAAPVRCAWERFMTMGIDCEARSAAEREGGLWAAEGCVKERRLTVVRRIEAIERSRGPCILP
jgi:hypothetical protein